MKREELDFGEYLVQTGTLTAEKLALAVSTADAKRQTLRKSLLDLHNLTSEQYETARAEYFGIPFMELRNYQADPQTLLLVSEAFARAECVFPIFIVDGRLAVAVADPTNLVTLDQMRVDCGMEIDLYYAPETAILDAISRNYTSLLGVTSKGAKGPIGAEHFDVPRLIDSLVERAVRDAASDIHIEPGKQHLLIRQRVDGELQEVTTLPVSIQPNVVSRVKVLAGLDISETRTPQDGHIAMSVGGEEVALRISTLPTLHGENVVIRILLASKARIALDAMQFSPANLQRLTRMIQQPHGIIVVTGPTGSGKTTTLYSVLDHINTVSKNIMTIEDPVEYNIDLLRQVQVNHKVGLTFSAGLRSILRQDPDVVMVGEIRDAETARVAVQAALTGHLVLSTLHTNDAPSTVTRFLQIGIQPFLLASSLIGVVAQRLVRRACTHCREPMTPPAHYTELVPDMDGPWFRPTGCLNCRSTGYRGRLAIHEVLEVTPAVQAQIVKRAPSSAYLRIARQDGMATMFEDGVVKVKSGLTTLDEVIGVVGELANELPESVVAP